MKRRWLLLAFTLILAVFVVGCANKNDKNDKKQEKQTQENRADQETVGTVSEGKKQVEATFKNTEGDNIGNAKLVQTDHGVEISLNLEKLPPGSHGFHIHEKGTCEPPSFESAGAHFNPTHKQHGLENPEGPHGGDLPNLNVQENGEVSGTFKADMVTLEKGVSNSLLKTGGTALVIHADPDDNKSQPAGNSGKRIACAEIKE